MAGTRNILICLMLAAASAATDSGSGPHTDDLIYAIRRLADYFTWNRPSRTPDAILGIQFAKLQLENLLTKLDNCAEESSGQLWHQVHSLWRNIAAILDEVKLTQSVSEDDEASENVFGAIINHHLLNQTIWKSRIPSGRHICHPPPMRHGQLVESFRHINNNLHQVLQNDTRAAYEALFDNIDQGLPLTYDSDKCLSEILNSLGGCVLSSDCLKRIMAPLRVSHGYHLTHKLFYFMVLGQRGCMSSLPINKSLQITIGNLCQRIREETHLIKSVGFPRDMRDLIVEQTFLCAFNGFAEYFDRDLIREILSWQQTQSGCFEFNVYNPETDPLFWKPPLSLIRRKRSASQLSHNCSDHMSGLALATMSQFLNYSF